MWEFDFQGKSVENSSGKIFDFEFVCVFVKLENLKDFSNNIEIFCSFISLI
jgi:hypothetical protein